MQKLSQQQRLLQKLSPQQIQLIKLIQVPTAYLEERIEQEVEENPALEVVGESGEEKTLDEKTPEEVSAEQDGNTEEEFPEEKQEEDDYPEIDIAEYVKEGDDEDE